MATLSESRPRDPSTATNPGVSPAARTRLVVASQALEIKELQDRLDAKDRQLAQAQAKDLQRQTEATAELAAARANERRVTAQAAVLGDRVRDLEQHVGPDAAPGQSHQKSLTHHTSNGVASNATVGGQPRENLVQQLRDDLRQARLQNQSLLQEREIAMQKLVQERSTVARLDAELQDVKEKLNNALDANKNTGAPAGSGSVAAPGAATSSFGHLHQNSTVGVGLTSILGKVDGVTQTDAALTAEDVEVIVVDAVRCAQQTQQALRRHPPNVAAQLPNRVSSFVASTANATPAHHGFPTEDVNSSTPIGQQAISTSGGEHQQKPPMSRFASVLPQTTYESDQVITLLQHHMQSCEDLLQMHRGAAAQEAANIGILQKALQEHLASQVAKLATEQEKYKRMMNPSGGGHGTSTSGGAFSAFSPSNHRSLNRAMGAAATSSTFTTQERLHRNATGFASGHAMSDEHHQRQDHRQHDPPDNNAGRASGGRGGSEEHGAWSDGAPGSQSDASDAFGPESKGPRLAAAAASMAKANHAASSQRGHTQHQHRRLPAPTSGQEERPEPLADDSFYPAEPTEMALRRRGHTAPPEHPAASARQEAMEGTIDALGAPRGADDDDASSIMDQGPKLAAVQRPRPAQQEPMYAPRNLDAEVPQTEVIDMDRSVSAADQSLRGASLRPNGGGGGGGGGGAQSTAANAAAAGLAASTINQVAGNTVNAKAAMDARASMSVSHRSSHREVIDTGAAEYNHHVSQPTPPPPPAAALQEVQERQQARRPSSTYPPPSVDDQSSDRFLDSDRFGPHHRTTKAAAGGNADLSRPGEPPHQRFDTGMEKRATADDDDNDEVRKRHDSTQHQPHYQQQHGGDSEGSQQQRHPYAIGEHQMRQVEWERSQRDTSADMSRAAADGGMMRTPRPGAPPQQSGGSGNYGGGSIDDGYSDPYAPTLVQYHNSQRPQELPLAQSSMRGQTPATPVNPAQATEGAKQKGPSPAERFAQQQQKELSSLRTRLQELQERHDKVKLSGPVPFVPQSTSNSNSRAGSMETALVHALPLGVSHAASHSGGQYHTGHSGDAAAAAAAAAGVPGFGGGAGGAGGVSSGGVSFSPNPYIASPSKSERPATSGPASQMATTGLASTLAARQLGGTLGASGTPGVAGAVGGEPASVAPVGMQRAQVGQQPQSVLQQMLSRATAAPDAAQRTARPE